MYNVHIQCHRKLHQHELQNVEKNDSTFSCEIVSDTYKTDKPRHEFFSKNSSVKTHLWLTFRDALKQKKQWEKKACIYSDLYSSPMYMNVQLNYVYEFLLNTSGFSITCQYFNLNKLVWLLRNHHFMAGLWSPLCINSNYGIGSA